MLVAVVLLLSPAAIACSGSSGLDRGAVVRNCEARHGVIAKNCGPVVDSLMSSASTSKLKCSTDDLTAALDDFASIASSSGQQQDVYAILRSHCH